MPGMPGRSRASSVDKRVAQPLLPSAWIAGLDQKVLYDLGPLSRGEQVCATRFQRYATTWTTDSLFPSIDH